MDLPHTEDGVRNTVLWWTLLRAIAVANLFGWGATLAMVDASQPIVQAQLGLSFVYVVVCAFRSFLPRIDLERTCLVDSPWSSMVAGRSAATIAEVSFAAQVGLFVHLVGSAAGLPGVQAFGGVVVVLLAVAQGFCWWSVVTLGHLGHAIEESIWALTFALIGGAMALSLPHLDGPLYTVALIAIPICVGYVGFMVVVDVPMYVKRWREGRAAGNRTLDLREGFQDALHRREVTRSWSVWKPEVAWLTGYFSFAVWISLGLVHIASAFAVQST